MLGQVYSRYTYLAAEGGFDVGAIDCGVWQQCDLRPGIRKRHYISSKEVRSR